MRGPLFQCVPNLSEGRRCDLLEELAQSLRAVPGLHLADCSWDADHNRSVFTLLGDAAALRAAVPLLYRWCDAHVDMSAHSGEHPRVGAVDVVPFIPLLETPMEAAVELSRQVAAEVAEQFDLPVYLYEEASTRAALRLLPDVRKGQLAGVLERLAGADTGPDFGPARLHPRLGATVIGARRPLVAYNIVLDTDDLSLAWRVARRVRERDGGLVSVRAIGVKLEQKGRVQVSMNLTDPLRTSLYAAFEKVASEARRYGVEIVSSELIGLTPLEVLVETARHYLRLHDFKADQVLERQLLEAFREGH